MPITFQNNEIIHRLADKSVLRSWIKTVIGHEQKKCGEINFVFTNDDTLLGFNRTFLHHNTLTDIITFDSCDDDVVNGDIIISIERVKENSIKYNVSYELELHRVMIHGVLHLCGYKDKTSASARKMRDREDRSLKLLAAQPAAEPLKTKKR